MSVAVCVYLHPNRVPSGKAWADAVRANGFDMSMDVDFNPRESFGGLPCTHQGKPAGFQYVCDLLEGQQLDEYGIGDPSRPVRVMLETGSVYREFASSVIAGGVLCAIADGILQDPDTEELIRSTDAIDWARRREAGCIEDIAHQESIKDIAAPNSASPQPHVRPVNRQGAASNVPASADMSWKAIWLCLAVAYLVAIFSLRPAFHDAKALIILPLLFLAVSAIFGLAVVGIARVIKGRHYRFRYRFVWAVATGIVLALIVFGQLRAP